MYFTGFYSGIGLTGSFHSMFVYVLHRSNKAEEGNFRVMFYSRVCVTLESLFSRLLRLRTRASRCLSAEGGYYTLLEVPARRFAAQLDTSSR